MIILTLISVLYFTSAKNNTLLLEPSPNKNYDVSFAPQKTMENISTFFAFAKKAHLKWEEILKIDRLKCTKSLISNKKKQKSFLRFRVYVLFRNELLTLSISDVFKILSHALLLTKYHCSLNFGSVGIPSLRLLSSRCCCSAHNI